MFFIFKKFFILTVLSLTLLVGFIPTTSLAQTVPNLQGQINHQINAGNKVSGLGDARPQELIARVIQIFLSTVGITFTVLIVIAGYNMLTAAGDEGKVEKAKNTIKACIIGLAITLGAYSITLFIGKNIGDVTTTGGVAEEAATCNSMPNKIWEDGACLDYNP